MSKLRITFSVYNVEKNENADFSFYTDEDGNVPLETDIELKLQDLIDEVK